METMQKYKKSLYIIGSSIILLIIFILFAYFRERAEVINYEKFSYFTNSNLIKSGYLDENYLVISTDVGTFKIAKELVDLRELKNIPIKVTNSSEGFSIIDSLMIGFMLFLLVILFTRKDKKEQVNLKKVPIKEADEFSNVVTPILSDVKFSSIAGMSEVKEELEEIIEFLSNPNRFKKFSIKLPKGVLLVGPPGVGKTMIAKAVAGEANVPFFYQSGASFVQIYVGMGAKRVRELFSKAKSLSPSIVFIDEIDAVGKARGGHRNDEREATLNQLLTEMDGFEDSSGVIVIGATNKIEMLDEALLRAGRFDRRIHLGLPNISEREAIIKLYLKDKPSNVDCGEVAKLTVGLNGATISNLVNESAINALRRGSDIIEFDDFLAVKDKVVLGKKQKLILSSHEKEILATYQSAKALVAYWFDVEFEKISLIDDGLKESDKSIISKTEMLAKIKLYLAGSVSLELKYGESYSNAKDDLAIAKTIATEMVQSYGFGRKLFLDIGEVQNILDECSSELKKLLSANIRIQRIEKILLEHEVISKDEIREIIHDIF